jgi:adenylate cyclase
VRVVGRREPVRVYEPVFREDLSARGPVFNAFTEGLQAYYHGDFRRALDVFSRISGDDPPAAAYVRRCRQLIDAPPSGWDGVWEMTEK